MEEEQLAEQIRQYIKDANQMDYDHDELVPVFKTEELVDNIVRLFKEENSRAKAMIANYEEMLKLSKELILLRDIRIDRMLARIKRIRAAL